jgi:hypothetical protein
MVIFFCTYWRSFRSIRISYSLIAIFHPPELLATFRRPNDHYRTLLPSQKIAVAKTAAVLPEALSSLAFKAVFEITFPREFPLLLPQLML